MNKQQLDPYNIAVGNISTAVHKAHAQITQQSFYDTVIIRRALNETREQVRELEEGGFTDGQLAPAREFLAALEHADMLARMNASRIIRRSFIPVLDKAHARLMRSRND